eukprot:COSAG05_NODE_5438_length_1173_cov_112.770950_3_plen_62_part_01
MAGGLSRTNRGSSTETDAGSFVVVGGASRPIIEIVVSLHAAALILASYRLGRAPRSRPQDCA